VSVSQTNRYEDEKKEEKEMKGKQESKLYKVNK
jgi:hypothetical protein